MHFNPCPAKLQHNYVRSTLAALIGLATVHLSAADFRASASTTLAQNINRASSAPSQLDAFIHQLNLSASTTRQLTSAWLGTVEGNLAGQWVPEYDGLDEIRAGFSLEARYKFGLGAEVPVLTLRTGISRITVREEARDAWRGEFTARLSRRWADVWQASAHLGRQQDWARSQPYDAITKRFGLELRWDATERWQFAGGATRIWGEWASNAEGGVWATALSGGLGPVIQYAYNEVAAMPSDTFGPGRITYRIYGHANQTWLEASYALGDNTTVAFRYEADTVFNQISIRYPSIFYTLSLLHRF